VIGPVRADAESLGRELHGAQLHVGAFHEVPREQPEHQVVARLHRGQERDHAIERPGAVHPRPEVRTQRDEIALQHDRHTRIDGGVVEAFQPHRLSHDQLVGLAAVPVGRRPRGPERGDERRLHRGPARPIGLQQRAVNVEEDDLRDVHRRAR
jgi:hypothetical protein